MYRSRARLVARQLLKFCVDMLDILSEPLGGQWERGFILISVGQANIAHVLGDPTFNSQFTYQRVTDDQRRPINISAISRGVAIPRETVRRHCKVLVSQGALERVGEKGYIVPLHYTESSSSNLALRKTDNRFYALIKVLSERGYNQQDGDLKAIIEYGSKGVVNYAIRRTYLRLFSQLIYGSIAGSRNVTQLMIETIINTRNVEYIDDEAIEEYDAVEAILADELRAPVTLQAIIDQTGMTRSTVYRSLQAMTRDGVLQRAGDGYIIPASRIEARAPLVVRASILFAACIRTIQSQNLESVPY